jgi:hypothetical protein
LLGDPELPGSIIRIAIQSNAEVLCMKVNSCAKSVPAGTFVKDVPSASLPADVKYVPAGTFRDVSAER